MQEFNYPDERNNPKIHKKIVENLLKGVFITLNSDTYESILKYQKWYEEFFKYSFDIELKYQYEVFYLIRLDGGSSITKRILTTIAILMYELNNKGIEPVRAIRDETFKIDVVNGYISESVQFSNFSEKNRVDSSFIGKLERLGLVTKIDDNRFMFTRAIEVFLNEFDDIKSEVSQMNDDAKIEERIT
jgi:hypothetical protein